MCGRHREARRAARHGCCGRRAAAGPVVAYEPRQSLVRQLVNHFIKSREQKRALASGQYVQRRALEQVTQGKQEMGVAVGRNEGGWVDEKQRVRIEDLGKGVDHVRGRSAELPSYREVMKN